MKKLSTLFTLLTGLLGFLPCQAQTICESQPVDIVFVVDVTSSMREVLLEVPQRFFLLADQFSRSDLRTGALVFRDYGENFVCQSSPLSNEMLTTLDFLVSFRAVGGGDDSEPLNEALYQLGKFSWRTSAVRLAIFISDAPPGDACRTGNTINLFFENRINFIALTPRQIMPQALEWQKMVASATASLLIGWENNTWDSEIKNFVCPPAESIEPPESSAPLYIYPNPAKHTATIQSSGETLGDIAVFDSIGKQIFAQPGLSGQAHVLDLVNWPPGIYWVKTGAGNGKLVVME